MDKVLIIEDSLTFSKMLMMEIQSVFDVECVPAYSLQEAVDILESNSDQFFCATIDINLPDATKGEAVNLIIDHYPNISPIVLTGKINEALREDMLQMNVADYVQKDGQHNLEYVASLVHRLYKNSDVKILITDDSATARMEMQRLLAVQRFQILKASSGSEAIDTLAENPDIRIALVDCNMEDMSGLELTEKFRENYSKEKMAIIGVSSSSGRNMSPNFIKSGANDFLVKPFQPEEFHCRINQNIEFLDVVQEHQQARELINLTLGTAAHDIRSPLSGITGLAGILLNGVNDDTKRDKYLNTLVDAANNLSDLVDNLLDTTAIEHGGSLKQNVQPTNLQALIEQRLTLYQAKAEEKSIRLNAQFEAADTILCDSNNMGRVLDNLLSNALKYSPSKSTIDILLTCSEKHIRVDINDQGTGIPEAQEKNLFGAYQTLGSQTTAGESSTGLGLAICKNIIDAHNGKIGYRHLDTGGSGFFFVLPHASNESLKTGSHD